MARPNFATAARTPRVQVAVLWQVQNHDTVQSIAIMLQGVTEKSLESAQVRIIALDPRWHGIKWRHSPLLQSNELLMQQNPMMSWSFCMLAHYGGRAYNLQASENMGPGMRWNERRNPQM
jgi:hypothetical protein